jgi:hypothetical protein
MINIKEWVKKKVLPHLVKECNGLLFPDDCVDMIENDLEGLVRTVRENTLESLISFIRKDAPELEHGDERWGVAKDVEDGTFEKWEKEANAFLAEAIGAPPVRDYCDYCPEPATRFTRDGKKMCAGVRCANSYRENKQKKSIEGVPSQEWSDEQHMLWLCSEHDKNGTQEFGGAEKDAVLRIIGRLRKLETPKKES